MKIRFEVQDEASPLLDGVEIATAVVYRRYSVCTSTIVKQQAQSCVSTWYTIRWVDLIGAHCPSIGKMETCNGLGLGSRGRLVIRRTSGKTRPPRC